MPRTLTQKPWGVKEQGLVPAPPVTLPLFPGGAHGSHFLSPGQCPHRKSSRAIKTVTRVRAFGAGCLPDGSSVPVLVPCTLAGALDREAPGGTVWHSRLPE